MHMYEWVMRIHGIFRYYYLGHHVSPGKNPLMPWPLSRTGRGDSRPFLFVMNKSGNSLFIHDPRFPFVLFLFEE